MLAVAALRSMAIVLVALALTQPRLIERERDPSVVYALDVSSSVSPAFIRSSLESIRAANASGKPAQARYVVFAEHARLLDSLESVSTVPIARAGAGNDRSAIAQDATNLEAAVELALSGFAPNHPKRLVLFSDGNQTAGDVWRALPSLRAQNVRVFTVPAKPAVQRDARVLSIEVPLGLREQEPVTVKVRVNSLSETPARVELLVGEERAGMQSAVLQPGQNLFVFPTQFSQRGANRVTARVSAQDDEWRDNDARAEIAWIDAKPRVLYVEGVPQHARYLREALQAQGIDVSLAAADRFTQQLAGVDAVIVSDVPASAFDVAASRRLEAFVREGGGLLFAAGESSYGERGFADSAFERLLPVQFEGKRKRKELDLVLLIDRSFSMGGRKLGFAKAAARATLDFFDERHRLSIVSFDSTLEDKLPLHEVGNKSRAEKLIDEMFAAGQTNIFTALWYAHRLLEDSTAKTKHVILLSDGQSGRPSELDPEVVSAKAMATLAARREARGAAAAPAGAAGDAAAVMEGVADTTALFADAGITLSTVTIGEDPNLEVMSALAEGAKGRSYVARDDAEIPSLFVAETKRLTGEAVVEKPFRPLVKSQSSALAGLDLAAAPALRGYVITKPKAFAEVLLEAKDQHPLLVQTHYGLGKTVAFLSDVKDRWAADWLRWPGYGKLWAQLVRTSTRRETAEDRSLTVSRERGRAVVSLTLLTPEGEYRNGLAPSVQSGASSDGVLLALRQVGPGRYQGKEPIRPRLDPYAYLPVGREDLARSGGRAVSFPFPDEHAFESPNSGLLRALSQHTGGEFAPGMTSVFGMKGDDGRTMRPLWHYFAGAALAAFLADMALRRKRWGRRVKGKTMKNT